MTKQTIERTVTSVRPYSKQNLARYKSLTEEAATSLCMTSAILALFFAINTPLMFAFESRSAWGSLAAGVVAGAIALASSLWLRRVIAVNRQAAEEYLTEVRSTVSSEAGVLLPDEFVEMLVDPRLKDTFENADFKAWLNESGSLVIDVRTTP